MSSERTVWVAFKELARDLWKALVAINGLMVSLAGLAALPAGLYFLILRDYGRCAACFTFALGVQVVDLREKLLRHIDAKDE